MIDRERTIKEFGYNPDDLSKGSGRKVWCICEDCKKSRLLSFRDYTDICKFCVKIGKRNNFYGKHHTDETKEKISKANMGKKLPSITGNKHPQWNPNLTDEERKNKRKYSEYYEWRTAVFERDNYICQICKENSKTLVAHHLDSFHDNVNKRILLENGITLCEKHHKDFHHQYGYGNNNKEQFIEFKARS